MCPYSRRLLSIAGLALVALSAFAIPTLGTVDTLGAMEDPTSIRWLRIGNPAYSIPTNSGPLVEFLEGNFNIDIDLIHLGSGVFDQHWATLLAADDMPDLFDAWRFDPALHGDLAQPYNDPLERGALPNFQAVLNRHQDAIATLTQTDGNMYVFPHIRDYPLVRTAPILRLDLLREGGFTGDTDVLDFDTFKVALQAMSQALDGAPPWLMRHAFSDFIREVAKLFGMNALEDFPVAFNYDACKYDIVTRMPNLKWMTDLLKGLYEDGLLHPEFSQMNSQVWSEHWDAGHVGFTLANQAWAANTPDRLNLGWDLQFGMSLTGPDGSTGRLIPDHPVNPARGNLLSIDSPARDVILKMVDWGYSDEGATFFNLGIEGLHWTPDRAFPSGMRFYHINYEGLDASAFEERFRRTVPYQKYGLNSYRQHGFDGSFSFRDPDIRFGNFHFAGPGQTHAQQLRDRYRLFDSRGWMLRPLPHSSLPPSVADSHAFLFDSIQEAVHQQLLDFILRAQPIQDYDNFVEQIENLGAQELLNLYNDHAYINPELCKRTEDAPPTPMDPPESCATCWRVGQFTPVGLTSPAASPAGQPPRRSDTNSDQSHSVPNKIDAGHLALSTVIVLARDRWGQRIQRCTGTHLGGGLVLTAGHCVVDPDTLDPYHAWHVLFGCDHSEAPRNHESCVERDATPVQSLVPYLRDNLEDGADVGVLSVSDLPERFAPFYLPLDGSALQVPAPLNAAVLIEVDGRIEVQGYEDFHGKALIADDECRLMCGACSPRHSIINPLKHGCDTQKGSSGGPILKPFGGVVGMHLYGHEAPYEDKEGLKTSDANCYMPARTIVDILEHILSDQHWKGLTLINWEAQG